MDGKKHKILIIEDDEYLSGIYGTKFEIEGFDVIQCRNGCSGLDKITKEKPDIVLLDILMPGMDGFEVLKQVKKNSELQEIPIIILSNLGQKEDIEKGKKLGAADYIIKVHLTPAEIVERVREILKKNN